MAVAQIQEVKVGKRLKGAYYHFDNGRSCYLHYQRQAKIQCAGKPTISEAIREGIAAWAIPVDTLVDLARKEIPIIGVLVRDTGDVYLTFLSDFYDHDKARLRNIGKSSVLYRFLPLQHWRRVRRGCIKL